MNLSRTFAASLSSTNGKRSLLFRCLLVQSSSQSTRAVSTETAAAAATTKKTASLETESKCPRQSEAQRQDPDAAPSLTVAPRIPPPVWPRPVEVPFQPKVANSVHLMGSVGMPVQLEVAPDGKYWAVSVLTQEKADDFPQLWIPIIFEGDLAQVAACHLKENDLIYVTGQLSGDPPPLNMQHGQTSTQVMVQGLSFAKKTGDPKRKTEAPYEQNGYAFDVSGNKTRVAQSAESQWRDLLDNPSQWWDHRMDKTNGLVKPRFPDFKHKETGMGVWIDRAPKWVLLGLEGLKFDVKTQQKNDNGLPIKISASNNASWKDLVDNPNNWRDYRKSKATPNYPDFKHKQTGEGLWLNSRTPSWALASLPPLEPNQGSKSASFF